MNGAEIVASFMEPKPALPARYSPGRLSDSGWWELVPIDGGGMEWCPAALTLDKLREVQARLTTEQRMAYYLQLWPVCPPVGIEGCWALLHASAEQKVAALAELLAGLGDALS